MRMSIYKSDEKNRDVMLGFNRPLYQAEHSHLPGDHRAGVAINM